MTTPGLVCTPGVIGSTSLPNVETPNPPGLTPPATYPGPPMNPGLPPTMVGGPTGVTTPGLVWMPGVIGSASTTPP